jgi:dual oxidase
MRRYYDEMVVVLSEKINEGEVDGEKEVKVGVFFCGPPVIGMQSADQCRLLTARGREVEGVRRVAYNFIMEVEGQS